MELEFDKVYLSTEDRNNITSKINQIHSQQFKIILAAITAFGAFLAWLIPKDECSTKSTSELLFISPALLLFYYFCFCIRLPLI